MVTCCGPCCRAASVLHLWNSHCKIELIFGIMLQFNVVWCIHFRREIVLTIQSDNGKQGHKVGGKNYCRPKVVLSRQPWRPIWQRLDSEMRGILSSQHGCGHVLQQEMLVQFLPSARWILMVAFNCSSWQNFAVCIFTFRCYDLWTFPSWSCGHCMNTKVMAQE